MEAEASPNRLPVKVIRNSGGYVREQCSGSNRKYDDISVE
jgi:hypothetical protein